MANDLIAGDGLPREIEIPHVIDALDVSKKARAQGVQNLPRTDSASLDGNEQTIVVHYERSLKNHRESYVKRAGQLQLERRELTNKINPAEDTLSLANLASALEPTLAHLSLEKRTQLASVREAQERSERHLRHFKAENNLIHRPAKYPQSWLQHFALILLVAAGEWLTLSVFYAEGSDYGLAGGVLIAAAFSIVNLSLAILVGKLFTYVNHVNVLRKAAAGIAAMLLAMLFFFVTIMAAHYRVATLEIARDAQMQSQSKSGAQPGIELSISSEKREDMEAAKKAWENMQEHLFGLHDVFAWVILVAAVIFAIFAAYKGYRSDDPYPGYGDVDRTCKSCERDYENAKTSYREALQGVFRDIEQKQNGIYEATRNNIRKFDHSINDSQNLTQKFNAETRVFENNCNAVLQKYHQENAYVATSPRPGYFNERVKLDAELTSAIALITQADLDAQASYAKALENIHRLLSEHKATLNSRYTATLNQSASFLADLERDIKEKVDREQVIGG